MARIAAPLLAGVLALGGVVAGSSPATAAVAGCENDNRMRGDLDYDGRADVVVGLPGANDGAGAVDLRYTGRPSQVLTAGSLGVGTGEGDRFGAALAVGDFNFDGCADLVIGAPREGTNGAAPYTGQVHVVLGSPTGPLAASTITLPHAPSNGTNFDDFGAALAVESRFNNKGIHDIYVGAPGASVAGKADAGAVFHYVLDLQDDGSLTLTDHGAQSQDSPGVPGTAEKGDRFGAVLSADEPVRGVIASAPKEDLGKATDAGSVWFLGVDADGTAGASYAYSQDSAGVPGKAETGDHFGASLGRRSSYVAVGVPGENSGRLKDTGLVQSFRQSAETHRLTALTALTQNSPGVPGTAEAGDRFGAAVAVGQDLLCFEEFDVAVGAPGEDVGSHRDAGTITLASLSGAKKCRPRTLQQGAELAGAPETGDQVGAVLGISRGATNLDEDYQDRLLIGVPHEDLGAQSDAGLVQPRNKKWTITVNGKNLTSLTYSGGRLAAAGYGQVLSSAFD